MKYGVTHYEPVASTILKIPCPVRPPVIYLDHDEEPVDVAAQSSDSELDTDNTCRCWMCPLSYIFV